MPTVPLKVHPIALLGFSDFERQTLGTCFRLGGSAGRSYALTTDFEAAEFLLADADDPPSVRLVLSTDRAASTVFIGADPPDDALCWMTRPIDPLRVMRELEAMALMSAAQKAGVEAPSAPDIWQPETQPGWEPEWPPGWSPDGAVAAPLPAAPVPAARAPTLPAPVPTAVDVFTPPPVPRSARPRRPTRAPVLAPRTALVVDDSEVASRFLRRRLEPWGLQVECAAASQQALALLEHRTYDLIFVDVELGPHSELDGLALCQRIKQSAATVGASVIVVSAHQSELDRARGALAGCDAYLGKPLSDDELAPLLSRRGLARAAVPAELG